MKKSVKILCVLVVLATMVLPTSALTKQNQPITFTKQSKVFDSPKIGYNIITPVNSSDFDPLDENIIVTVTINEIRALQKIDARPNPNFYIKVKINDNEFMSDVWQNMKYVENPNWSASCMVPKDREFVNITIELWSKNSSGADQMYDISPKSGTTAEGRRVQLIYSIATGIWWGDDYLGDPSGYGRLNGCDDGTIYQNDKDAEMLFKISQNDFDGDGFPYWLEVNMYNTSPLINNRGEDNDKDGVPIEWEYTFGVAHYTNQNGSGYYLIYDPNKWENHKVLDPDKDGLTNWEEYKTSQWGSDPFRQDIFIEIDQMAVGSLGQGGLVPVEAYDVLRTSYAKHNIYWHIDDGRLGGGGIIPFKETLDQNDTSNWYWNYFMHGDANNWRRGVFRWCIVSYDYIWAKGQTFSSRIGNSRAVDCFFLSTKFHEFRAKIFVLLDGLARGTFTREMARVWVYAGGIMHETGHTLNIRAPGVDDFKSVWPWQVNFWKYAPYKSCMNYRYIYRGVVDYSDGSRGGTDYNDWGSLDLTYFNPH
jgi:hypothetical protein